MVGKVNKATALHQRLDLSDLWYIQDQDSKNFLYRQTRLLWRNKELHHRFPLLRTCSITNNLTKPKGMVSLQLFDMQIHRGCYSYPGVFAFSLWKTNRFSRVLPVPIPLAATSCTTAVDRPRSAGGASPAASHGHARDSLTGESLPWASSITRDQLIQGAYLKCSRALLS